MENVEAEGRPSRAAWVSWLESKAMYITFSSAAWISVFLGVCVLVAVITGKEYTSPPFENLLLVISAFVSIGLLALAMLMITLGMVVYCIGRERKSAMAKAAWLLLFFFTAPFGPTLYFFCVYRKKVLAFREEMNG